MIPYPGNPTAVQAPSPAPGPNVVPIVNLPQDGIDDVNASSVTQELKVPADFIAWLMQVAGGTRTAKALVADGTGGTTTAATSTVDSPRIVVANTAGNLRFLVDHNGFPDGRINVMREEWLLTQAATSTPANPLSNYPLWMSTISGAGAQFNGAGSFMSGATVYGGRSVDLLAPSTTNALKSFVATTNKLVDPTKTAVSYVLEGDVAPDLAGVNNATVYFGLSNSQDPTTATHYAWIKKASADTTWQAQCAGGGSATTVDTGVTALGYSVPNPLHRFRIELHGSATPYGAVTVRFSVDDSAFVAITTNVPTAQLYLAFGATTTSNGGGFHDVAIGSIRLVSNLFTTAAG